MKKILTFAILMLLVSTSYSQNFLFGGNVTISKSVDDSIDNEIIYGTYNFNINIDNKLIHFEAGEASYDEKIISINWAGSKLQVWSEGSYYECYYAPLLTSKKWILINEYPYGSQVQARQYYYQEQLYLPQSAHK